MPCQQPTAALLLLTLPFKAKEPSGADAFLLQTGAAFSRIVVIKVCKSSTPRSARWRYFLGKGGDGAFPGAEILKRRLSSEERLEWHKAAIWHRKNNRNNSTSTAGLALLSPFIQRFHLYPATRILIHSLIISCLDYCNNVCAKLLFFFFLFNSTLQGYSELPCLLCFSLQYPCCSHIFLPIVFLLYAFSYIWNQDWKFNVLLQSFKNLKATDSNLLCILQSICWACITAATQILHLSFVCLKYRRSTYFYV